MRCAAAHKCATIGAMLKTFAIRVLGGTPTSAAQAIGISVSAVCQWPEVLPDKTRDRVQAAQWRRRQAALRKDASAVPADEFDPTDEEQLAEA